MTDDQIKLIKDEFIENYITVTPFQNEHQEVDFRYTHGCNQSKRTINVLKRRMKKVRFFRDRTFIYKSILSVLAEVVYPFKPKHEDFDWNEVNVVGSDENKQLHKYVFNGLKYKLDELATDLAGKKTMIIDGQKHYLEFEGEQFISLDELIESEDDEDYTIHEIVTDENNFFLASTIETEDSHFWRWYKENKGEVELVDGEYQLVKKGFLTKTQLVYLAENADPYLYNRKKRSYFNKVIADRTHKQFKKQFPDTEIDRGKVFNIKQAIDYLNHIILMTEGKDNKGELLSKWIVDNVKNYSVTTFIQDYFSKYAYDVNSVIYTKGNLVLSNTVASQIIVDAQDTLGRLYEQHIKALDNKLNKINVQFDFQDEDENLRTRNVVINTFGVMTKK